MTRHEEGTGHRHARLQELMLEELRSLFSDDISDPVLEGVAVVAAVLSIDYRHLRVHYAAPSPGKQVEHALQRATPFLRRNLADSLDLKIVPDLRFVAEVTDG
jgi:ribosome-binding factor A